MSPMSGAGSGGSGDGGTTGREDTGTHPEVGAAVRLLHRRRGWGWTGGGSLLALVVFSVIGSHLWANASGALGVITGLVLLALTVAGLVMAVVDTVRLQPPRRRGPGSGPDADLPPFVDRARLPVPAAAPRQRLVWPASGAGLPGPGHRLPAGPGQRGGANAIIAIIVGLFLDAVGVLAGLALIKMTQHWLKRRRESVLSGRGRLTAAR
jgi:hypothetical protein